MSKRVGTKIAHCCDTYCYDINCVFFGINKIKIKNNPDYIIYQPFISVCNLKYKFHKADDKTTCVYFETSLIKYILVLDIA
jgi:hypothetical protein